jgi:hypothetical protein
MYDAYVLQNLDILVQLYLFSVKIFSNLFSGVFFPKEESNVEDVVIMILSFCTHQYSLCTASDKFFNLAQRTLNYSLRHKMAWKWHPSLEWSYLNVVPKKMRARKIFRQLPTKFV